MSDVRYDVIVGTCVHCDRPAFRDDDGYYCIDQMDGARIELQYDEVVTRRGYTGERGASPFPPDAGADAQYVQGQLDIAMETADGEVGVRTFETGATRDTAEGKKQFEGYLSPRVLDIYGDYMLKHQYQSDGKKRESDNWTKGIPLEAYRDSLIRHVFEAWDQWRSGLGADGEHIETLCAILFNTMGMIHELTRWPVGAPISLEEWEQRLP